MDTIRDYLESMFARLPQTPEVLRAKGELSQMMEDKYDELVAEGMREDEAVGTVIAEFGDIDEVAETLGITEAVRAAGAPVAPTTPGAVSGSAPMRPTAPTQRVGQGGRHHLAAWMTAIIAALVIAGAAWAIWRMWCELGVPALSATSPAADAVSLSDDIPTDFSSVTVDVNVAHVEIRTGPTAHISCSGFATSTVTWEVVDGTLDVRTSRPVPLLSPGWRGAGTVTITIPAGTTLGDVSCSSDTGNVEVSGIACSNLSLHTDMGDVTVRDVPCAIASIETGIGDARAEHVDFANSLSVTTDMGDVQVIASDLGDARISLKVSLGTAELDGQEVGSTTVSRGTGTRSLTVGSNMGDVTVTSA